MELLLLLYHSAKPQIEEFKHIANSIWQFSFNLPKLLLQELALFFFFPFWPLTHPLLYFPRVKLPLLLIFFPNDSYLYPSFKRISTNLDQAFGKFLHVYSTPDLLP